MAGRVISAILSLRDRNFSSGLRDASGNLTDFGRQFQRVENGVKKFEKSAATAFKNVAKGAAGLAAAGITGIGVAAAKTAIEMDTAFSTLSAKTNTTGSELESLKTMAKEVYTNGFGESLTQVTDDLAVLKQTLGTVDDKTLESTQILARLSENADVDSVARALRSMTASFPGATQQQSLDLITKTLQVGGDASGDLLDTFNEYSGIIGSMGIGMDNFANIMVNGAKAGARNYDVVADTLKEFNIAAKTGSDDTRAAFQALGMDADKVAADLAAGGERGEKAYYDTMKALSQLDDTAKYSVGVALMGTKFEDLESSTIEAMGTATDALGEFDGATAKAGEALQNNFTSRMTSAWRELKVGLAEAFSSEGGTEMLDWIATKAEELVPKIQGMVTAAINFGNSVRDNWGTIGPILATAGAAIGTFVVVMGTMKAIQGISALINGFRSAMALATAGQWAMNTAMLASPWTWVAVAIAAVVAAGVALYLNWEKVKAGASALWEKIQNNPFAMLLLKMNPITGVALAIYQNFEKIKTAFDKFKNAISNFKMPSWVSSIGSTIGKATSAVGNFINGSHATGLNRVPFDGYIAELHKDEMVIPARQSKLLRQQGVTIDNIDTMPNNQASTPVIKTTTTNNTTGGGPTVIIQNLNAKGVTASEVVNELVPLLKMRLANM